MGVARFTAAVRHELPAWGATRICRRIITGLFNALDDVVGVVSHRHGVLERAEFVIDDWREIRARRDDVETRMLGVLDALELTELLDSIPGVSLVGAAAVLAETGDPTRFTSARALVKHSGLCPRENSSGEHRGRSRLSGRGRPELRTAVWCAAWGAQHGNPVLAARHAHLTGREHNRLSDGQARAACAATLLRWLHAIVTRRVPFDADIAAGRRQPLPAPAAASGGAMAA
jgi:transposase